MYIITGVSGGIGKFLFKELLNQDEDVFGAYNTNLPDDLPSDKIAQVDVSSSEQVKEFVLKLPLDNKKVNLINCAGINYNAFAHKSDPSRWGNVVDVNLKGSYHMSAELLPHMRKVSYGRIIMFSSVVARVGGIGTSAYASSKSGLAGLTRTLANENASKGITVNSINLGYFDIGMIKEVPAEILDGIIKRIPLGCLGDPVEILKTVQYIIASDYLTGSSIDLNGGLN